MLILSHLAASMRFWKCLRRGYFPSTSDFASLGIILYYDLGLMLEALGYSYANQYFTSIFECSDKIFLTAIFFIIVLPWIFHLGSTIINRKVKTVPLELLSGISGPNKVPFYFIIIALVVSVTAMSISFLFTGNPIWVLRDEIGTKFGPLIIIFYIPLFIMAFYVRQINSRKVTGFLLTLFFVITSIISTIPLGQRTNLLLPVLILVIFYFKPKVKRLIAIGVVLVIIAAILLPSFKWQYANKESKPDTLVLDVVNSDFYRLPVLATIMNASELFGTRLLPYPMEGYVYSLLFFFPRQIVYFKGESTAKYFTSWHVDTSLNDTNWGFGIGVVEELLLNIGVVGVIPGLLIFGLLMGLCDRISRRYLVLVVPTRLGAIWLIGYQFPTVLLTFGSMSIAGLLLYFLFVNNRQLLPSINRCKRIKPIQNPIMTSSIRLY